MKSSTLSTQINVEITNGKFSEIPSYYLEEIKNWLKIKQKTGKADFINKLIRGSVVWNCESQVN